MATGSAADELKLPKIHLQKINNRDEDVANNISSNINEFFITFEEVNTSVYDIHMNGVFRQIDECLEEYKSSCHKIIKKIEDKYQSKKASKKTKVNKSANAIWEDEQGEDIIRKNMTHLTSEWKVAVEGEFARLKLRLSLLLQNGSEIYQEYINMARDMYQSVYTEINKKYCNEIQSITTACEILARATELEVPIEPELVLDIDKFSVKHESLLYEKLPCLSPDPSPQRQTSEDTFTIEQLSHIVDILKQIAPSGLISERAFIYLLQDLIANAHEDNGAHLMPKLWQKMRPSDLNELSTHLFARNEYVQWRDFILCNMPVTFPTEHDLMEFRKACRECDPDYTELIKDYQLTTINAWFDDCMDQSVQLSVKRLLFRMYAIDEETINYTCMLLDFCKDVDPIVGFVKALELSIGRYICYDREMGDEYVSALYNQRLAKTECAKRKKLEKKLEKMIIKEIVKEMVDSVVHHCESIIIEDLGDGDRASLRKSFLDDSLRVEFTDVSKLDVCSERSSQQVIMEEDSVDMESHKTSYTSDSYNIIYTLKIEPVLCVITAALPWQASFEQVNGQSIQKTIETIFEDCKNHELNVVFAYQFLNNKIFKELIKTSTKFTAIRSEELIFKVLGKI